MMRPVLSVLCAALSTPLLLAMDRQPGGAAAAAADVAAEASLEAVMTVLKGLSLSDGIYFKNVLPAPVTLTLMNAGAKARSVAFAKDSEPETVVLLGPGGAGSITLASKDGALVAVDVPRGTKPVDQAFRISTPDGAVGTLTLHFLDGNASSPAFVFSELEDGADAKNAKTKG